MSSSLLHTPEGVRDIYEQEYARKEAVAAKVSGVLKSYGYQGIQTPTFEYFDIFNKERGSVVSREMYKFFDREGETLVLRPDMTPSIARCAAKYYMFEDMPVRLCYEGNTFINNVSYRGSLKEATFIGAELINDTTTDADAEMVAMLVECLKVSGLREFQVEIGLVDYFNGLMEDAGLNEDEQGSLKELIEQKNYFGVEELVSNKEMEAWVKDALLTIPRLFGGVEQIAKAREITRNERSLLALDRLEKLYSMLNVYGLDKYVTFDLGMLGKYKYYTGIIFKAYTYGTGAPVATGGRYDGLLAQFGKDAPATGFGINLDELMTAIHRQKLPVEINDDRRILLYDRRQKTAALELAKVLRNNGRSLVLMKKFLEKTLEDYVEYAKRTGITVLYYIDEIGEEVSIHGISHGDCSRMKLEDLLNAEEN